MQASLKESNGVWVITLSPQTEDEALIMSTAASHVQVYDGEGDHPASMFTWLQEIGLDWGIAARPDGMATLAPDGKTPLISIYIFRKGQ